MKPPKKKKRYRVLAIGPFSQGSLGVYETKAEANAFKKRTRAKWREPSLKKLMKDTVLTVVPLSEEENSKYHG